MDSSELSVEKQVWDGGEGRKMTWDEAGGRRVFMDCAWGGGWAERGGKLAGIASGRHKTTGAVDWDWDRDWGQDWDSVWQWVREKESGSELGVWAPWTTAMATVCCQRPLLSGSW